MSGATPRPAARDAPSARLRSNAPDVVRNLYPGYFALVMATGITSTAMLGVGLRTLSVALLLIAAACGVVLLVLYGWRLVAAWPAVRDDLFRPATGFAFFTLVAGLNVVGARLAADGHYASTLALLLVSLVPWLLLSYVVPAGFILGERSEPVLAGVNGTWFIWVVGTQSVAVSTAALEPWVGAQRRELALASVLMWSTGMFLYVIVATLVLVRLLLFRVAPSDLTPPYWVAMGATAITVLSGARLLDMSPAPALTVARPVVAGMSLALWAFGTWLVPMLLIFGVWRHLLQRVRLAYTPSMWSIVFPVGMYGVASAALGQAADLPLLKGIGHAEAWVALVVWTAAFLAMLDATARGAFRRRSRAEGPADRRPFSRSSGPSPAPSIDHDPPTHVVRPPRP